MASRFDGPGEGPAVGDVDIRFSHVQLYADRLLPLADYKELETSSNAFRDSLDAETGDSDVRDEEGAPFVPHGRDVVKQLIAGLGFRITGRHPDTGDGGIPSAGGTSSFLLTSSDPDGVRILVTAAGDGSGGPGGRYRHFDASNLDKFYRAHSERQGIAVLAFQVGGGYLDQIHARYSRLHPRLLPDEYGEGAAMYEGEGRVLEAFAYYEGEKVFSAADEGTRLRFVEPGPGGGRGLPGIAAVPAEFRGCRPAYFDHWVSNVVSRTGFLETLEDVLSFTPKVDFNAGVVAAGEAQIESTVTGNTSPAMTAERGSALRDQSQIYLPINNAVTKVGHVHGFLEEIGQGVQHVASRVGNIVEFVQEANDRRRMFGEGFSFLNIPRSYYGILTKDMLVNGLRKNGDPLEPTKGLLSPECAGAVYDICASGGLMHDDCSLALDVSGDEIKEIIDSEIPASHREEYSRERDDVVKTILRSRYANLYNLLRDHLSEESYVAVVRNQILVDVQGEDLLFQIFTSNILQREAGDEAPFLEFIQRVCSECTGPDGCPRDVKPGCGGFGIRNFLTLFLSIEVTRAMLEASNAKDEAERVHARRKVELFAAQLDESNPLLTEISDAMTREGAARDAIAAASLGEEKRDGEDGAGAWRLEMERQSRKKAEANGRLMECNLKYQGLMRELREGRGQ